MMKAEERAINRILTDQILYEIPPYQRPYSWDEENVQQLLEDILDAYNAKSHEYFMGSIITIEKMRDCKYEVVDGQQRLTTLSLIFACISNRIADQAAEAEIVSRIRPRNVLTGESETPRLILRKRDQNFFYKYVLEGQPFPNTYPEGLEVPQQHIYENMKVINNFCDGRSDDFLKLFVNYILTKVYVVFVKTDSLESAYRLFNVLNARGMPLSNADLIKNTLFSRLGTQMHRSKELDERWQELENVVGIEQLDSFFSHFRTSIIAAKARETLHEEIKTIIPKTDDIPFGFLDRTITSAYSYTQIIESNFTDTVTLRALRTLQRVKYDEWIPPLLAFLNNPVPGFPQSEFFNLLGRITIQNWVRRLGRTARLTVYYQLINAIKENKNAVEVRNIFRKNSQNNEFLDFLKGDLYGKPFDAAILFGLEDASQDESVTKIYNGRTTIEHILPQTLKDDYWKTRFSEAQHKEWVHRLGNLALLCGHKNYKAQYYDFDRKKKIYNDRNRKVSFDLTKEICEESEWTVDAIKARHIRLLDLAKQIWTIN